MKSFPEKNFKKVTKDRLTKSVNALNFKYFYFEVENITKFAQRLNQQHSRIFKPHFTSNQCLLN